ncbi:MAG: hypothetical protein NT026_01380 [Candidatus Staskawiczbacteria bacterium]|nr:hypothetical protein [Candidatus Staskawiczbacteria bacterium]
MENKIKCPKCGVELPQFDERGQHNFCPTSEFVPGKILNVCMKCKMEEVVREWKKA